MKPKKNIKRAALLILVSMLLLVAMPVSRVISAEIKERRTHALIDYIKRSDCMGSSSECYISKIYWLIDNGADVNANMPNGIPMTLWCAKRNHPKDFDIIQYLQRAGTKPNEEAQRIVWKAKQQAFKVEQEEINEMFGDSLIGRAISNDNVPTIKQLIANGADVHAKCNGEPLLSFALRHCDNPEIISLLKAAGAPTNPAIEMTIAVVHNNPDEVKKLVKSGVDVNILDKEANDNWTPLMWAANEHHTEMARLLLRLGANPHLKGNDYWENPKKWTALRVAEQSMGDWNERKKTIALLKTTLD